MATNPRDKVYGQLGLLPRTISYRIIVDYSLTVRQIFVNCTKATIEATGSLKIILLGNRQGLQKNWPSWVPDLRLGCNSDHILVGFMEPYRASSSSSAKVQFSDEKDILSCEGFRIATITQRNPKPRLPTEGAPLASKRHLPFHKRYHQGEEEAAIVKLFTTASKRQESPSSINLESDMSVRLASPEHSWADNQQFEAEREHAFGFMLSGELGRQLKAVNSSLDLKKGEPLIAHAMVALEQMYWFSAVFMSRNIICTVEGHAIFTPHMLEPGDVICILFGCNYPVILRPEGGFYKVMGECYIYDLKEGESLTWLDQGKYQVEMFEIW